MCTLCARSITEHCSIIIILTDSTPAVPVHPSLLVGGFRGRGAHRRTLFLAMSLKSAPLGVKFATLRAGHTSSRFLGNAAETISFRLPLLVAQTGPPLAMLAGVAKSTVFLRRAHVNVCLVKECVRSWCCVCCGDFSSALAARGCVGRFSHSSAPTTSSPPAHTRCSEAKDAFIGPRMHAQPRLKRQTANHKWKRSARKSTANLRAPYPLTPHSARQDGGFRSASRFAWVVL